jgi:hypothetical protein
MTAQRKIIQEAEPLLVSRKQAAAMLGGVDISTIRRLEQEGRLRPVRLSRSAAGQVFFRIGDVRALAEGSARRREAGDD